MQPRAESAARSAGPDRAPIPAKGARGPLALRAVLAWRYPREGDTRLPSKLTATALRETVRQAEAAVDEVEQDLSANLETAVAVRDNSIQALASALASVRSAKENLETAQEQLTIGSVSRIELSDAIASYSSALGDSITAFYAGQRAEAALFALVGRFPVYSEATVKGGGDEE